MDRDLIRAAVCRSFGGPLAIEEVELRRPGAGEVGVRVAACAICHSDLAFLRGVWGGELPAVYGHEAAGIVEEVGAGVDGLAAGDHVVVTLVRHCGRCALCRRGQPALCERPPPFAPALRAADGSGIHQGLRAAAFAERVTVHASQVVPVPADVPLASAALLACGVVTGIGAVLNTAAVEAGSAVAVVGAGGVGLNAVQGAVLAGARTILAVDLVEEKLAAARAFGATDAALAGELSGRRGFDYVFVTAASAQAVEQALPLLAPGGALVLVGMPGGATVAVDPERVADRGLRILGSKMGGVRPQRDIPRLVELYRDGRVDLDELISARFPLERIADAVAAAETADALRIVVTTT